MVDKKREMSVAGLAEVEKKMAKANLTTEEELSLRQVFGLPVPDSLAVKQKSMSEVKAIYSFINGMRKLGRVSL